MADQKLVDYIKSVQAQGYPLPNLRAYLLERGYKEDEVDEAMEKVEPVDGSTNTKVPKPGSTNATGIRNRSPLLVLVLSIITFNIYGWVWLVLTTQELQRNTKVAPNPWMLLLLIIPVVGIPVVYFIYFWKYAQAINEISGFNTVVLFVLFMFFWPVAQVLSQVYLNRAII